MPRSQNSGSTPAIILSAGATGLGAARSLHRAGVRVVALAVGDDEPVLRSRCVREKLTIPSASPDGDIVARLEQIGAGPGVLLPTSDRFVAFMLEHRERLSRRFFLVLPPPGCAESLLDKSVETALVERVGVPIPRTLKALPRGPEQLLAELALPIIVKPRSFRTTGILGKNRIVRRAEEARAFYAEHGHVLGAFMAQEVIPGDDDALWVCNCTFDRSHRLVSAFTFRRLRTAPAHFGVTSYAVSETNREVIDLVATLGRRLGYVGPAMVEFKRDPRDDVYRYIELNPRVGMCNAFDARCGVDNVVNAYRLARGEVVPCTLGAGQEDGIVFVAPFEDVYARLVDGEHPARILGHYASDLGRRHVDLYFAWNDPAPAALMVYRSAQIVVRVLARGARRRLGASRRRWASAHEGSEPRAGKVEEERYAPPSGSVSRAGSGARGTFRPTEARAARRVPSTMLPIRLRSR